MYDLTGLKFGRLVAENYVAGGKWLCLCACGTRKAISSRNLMYGKSKSCGCAVGESASKRFLTHGLSKTRIYWVWHSMLQRCTKPANKEYKNYGGRGITVCKRWHEFVNFFADMGERPAGLTLERKDNNGPYSPSNCVRASPKTQARNTRRNRMCELDGKTQCLIAWAEELDIPHKVLAAKLYHRKGDFAAAVLACRRRA